MVSNNSSSLESCALLYIETLFKYKHDLKDREKVSLGNHSPVSEWMLIGHFNTLKKGGPYLKMMALSIFTLSFMKNDFKDIYTGST